MKAQAEDNDDEVLLEIEGSGNIRGGAFSVRHLTSEERQKALRSAQQYVAAAKPGDFVWLWIAPIPAAEGEAFQYVPHIEKELTERADEILVKCVARANQTILFEYYPTDRLQAMRGTILQSDTTFLSATLHLDSSGELQDLNLAINGRPIALSAAFPIGPPVQVVSFLRRYIETKEGRPNGMSSCYMYHAAASMPQALLYATEILCVLMGFKPLTLVSLTTSASIE